MKILFLGTGASLGTPVLGCKCEVCRSADLRDRRLRSSLYIENANEHILIDPGPDFRQQCLTHHITHIDSFLITHPHHDHIGGMDETRAIYYAMNRTPLQFYAEKFSIEKIHKYYDYLFPLEQKPQYHGAPEAIFNEIHAGEIFNTKNNRILALRAYHGPMPVTGFKIGNLVYMTDVKEIPEETSLHINNDTMLIISALHVRPHALHFNLEEALEFVRKVKPRRTYLTHISHWMGLYKNVSRILPENVYLAYDGLEIII